MGNPVELVELHLDLGAGASSASCGMTPTRLRGTASCRAEPMRRPVSRPSNYLNSSLNGKGLPERHRHQAAAAVVCDLDPVIQVQMALANRFADQRPGVLDRPFAGRGEIGLFTAFFVNGEVVVADMEKITWHPAKMRRRRLSFPA